MKIKYQPAILVLFIMCFNCFKTSAQAGIYRTVEDYKKGNAEYVGNMVSYCTGDFCNAVTFELNGKEHRYNKSEIWGYRDDSNTNYIFSGKGCLAMILEGKIILYGGSPDPLAKYDTVIKGSWFYFSDGIDGDIKGYKQFPSFIKKTCPLIYDQWNSSDCTLENCMYGYIKAINSGS